MSESESESVSEEELELKSRSSSSSSSPSAGEERALEVSGAEEDDGPGGGGWIPRPIASAVAVGCRLGKPVAADDGVGGGDSRSGIILCECSLDSARVSTGWEARSCWVVAVAAASDLARKLSDGRLRKGPRIRAPLRRLLLLLLRILQVAVQGQAAEKWRSSTAAAL